MKNTGGQVRKKVEKIIETVRAEGDSAVSRWTEKFDGVKMSPGKFAVNTDDIFNSGRHIDRGLKKAILSSKKNIELFHREELKRIKKTWTVKTGDCKLGQVIRPVENAGIYVSGGRYNYPSVVLMTAIPALVAGVKDIVMVTPPGNLTAPVLFAAKCAGIKRIFRVGGAQAIAALAIGTETIPKVDFIAGPGNEYVTEAKRQLFGEAGIDLLAGPSELAVITDGNANPEAVAYDLLAQAEHSPEAKVWLFSSSKRFTGLVKRALYSKTKNKKQFNFTSAGINALIRRVNDVAPEHLEIMLKNPHSIIPRIKNAGAIFVGDYSPVALGDYYAGPSHVLPTNATARFSSGLCAQTFMKCTSIIEYTRGALKKAAGPVMKLAESEKLYNHAKSLECRFTGGQA